MNDEASFRHREPPLGGVAIHTGKDWLLALDGRVAALLAMTMAAPDSSSSDSGD